MRSHEHDEQHSPLPSTVDDALTATSASFAIGGAALAIAFPPLAVALSVSAGATQLLQLVQRRYGKRVSQVAYGSRERLGSEEADAARRLTEDEDLAALAYKAVDASMLSHHEEQARALGHVLGEALKAEPTITVDEASLIMDALQSIDLVHLQVLRALRSSGESGRTQSDLGPVLGDRMDLVPVVIAGLQRVGAVDTRLPLAEDPPGSGLYGQALEPTCSITAFGATLLAYTE